jgi:DNA-binding IscR family transcriptional regulator
MGQLLITETEKRDYLRFAFYARKQYRDNWIQRIETELQDQTLNKKAINKKMTALEAWKNLHPVIERYPDEIMNTWEELPLNELWKTIKADRDLADVLLNGLWRMKLNIEEGREFQCLQKLDYEIVKKETENITCGFVAGKDARDVKAWEVLQQLEDSLHSLFRPVEDQQQPASQMVKQQENGRPGTAKRPAIEFIKKAVQDEPEYQQLRYMKQGADGFKLLKKTLYDWFIVEHSEYKAQIQMPTFSRYLTDALNELFPDRKETSDF